MTISDWLMILAVLLGPITAVQVQKFIERSGDKRKRKVDIFKTLMATRGTKLSPFHVEALNRIDLEFTADSRKERPILDCWKLYLDHLNTHIDPKDADYQSKLNRWGEKSNELLVELLFAMAGGLGYEFDKVQLKRGIYTPQGHADLEFELFSIRKSLIDLFLGNKSFPIFISGMNPPSQYPRDKDTNV